MEDSAVDLGIVSSDQPILVVAVKDTMDTRCPAVAMGMMVDVSLCYAHESLIRVWSHS